MNKKVKLKSSYRRKYKNPMLTLKKGICGPPFSRKEEKTPIKTQ